MATRTVGVGKTYSTITAAVTAAVSGDTIAVDAGVYMNNSMTITKNLIFQGIGGFAICDSNQNTVNDKAYFAVQASVSFDAFEFRNATGSSGNIAGIKLDSGNVTCTNCWFHNNQMGILAQINNVAGAFVTLTRCEFNNNGTGTGSTHNIYIGLIPQLTISNCLVHDSIGGNEIKSRAVRTDITATRIFGNTGNSAYELDFPDGGICNVSGCVIQQSVNTTNSNITEIGAENLTPAAYPTNSATFSNCIIVNDRNPGTLFSNPLNFTYSWTNTQLYSVGVLNLPATMSNNTTLATRPTLDNSHPWIIAQTISGAGSAAGVSTVSGKAPVVGATTRTVGTGKTYATIQAAYTAAVSGDTIAVDAGTYNDISLSVFKDLTFTAVGGFVILDSTVAVPNDEGYFKIFNTCSFDHYEFRNATGGSGNVCGLRIKSGNITLTNCWFHNNQQGILIEANAAGIAIIDKCEFDHNGTNTGLTHNLYCGVIAKLTVTNSYFHDCQGGNEFKSRAWESNVTACRIHGKSSNSNWEMDFPEGGKVTVTNCVIQQSANTQNNNMTDIGAEFIGTAPINSATFSGCTVINDRATAGALFYNPNNFTYSWNLTNIWKVDVLDLPANMTNTTMLSLRPTLDTSHPWATNSLTVGVGKTYSTIGAAYTAAANGDTIVVDAGVYNNISMTIAKDITFLCVDGFAVLDSNQNTVNDKGYFVIQANVNIDHFEFRNAVGASGNCGGIRHESGTLTISNCWFHHNQMGVMSADNSYTGIVSIDRCEFNNNGTGSGLTHNMYIGQIAQLQVTNSYYHDCLGGNEFKSRAKLTDVSATRVQGLTDNGSWEMDFPTGGVISVNNCVIQQSINSLNSGMTNIGAEGLDLSHPNSISFYNCTVINDIPLRGILFSNPYNATYSWDQTNIWYYDYLELPAVMTNNNLRPSRPTLDLSHPWLGAPNIGNSQGVSTVVGKSASGSKGTAAGTSIVLGVVPTGTGANKFYTADRQISTAGATGVITSTHPNNPVGAWRSVLIGVEAAQVVNPVTISRAGVAAGVSSVSAIGNYGPYTVSRVGSAAGVSSVNATGAYGPYVAPSVGNAAGLASTNAIGAYGPYIAPRAGSAAGLASVNATGAYGPYIFASKGTSTGVSSVAAISTTVAYTFSSVGSSQALSSVNATGAYGPYIFNSQGISTGVGGANAIGAYGPFTFASKGTSAGIGSANAIGAYGPFIFTSRGISAGLSSVSANGGYGIILPSVGNASALTSVFAYSSIVFTIASVGTSTGLGVGAAVGFSIDPPPPPPPDTGPGTSLDWTIHPELVVTEVIIVG